MTSRRLMTAVTAAAVAGIALQTVPALAATTEGATTLRVAATAGCSTTAPRADVLAGRATWCSPAAAARFVRPGDHVVVSPGRYEGTVTLGAGASATTWSGEGATLDGGAGRSTLVVRGASQVDVTGFGLVGGTAQAVWVEDSSAVRLAGVRVTGSGGAGIQFINSRDVELSGSVVDANTRVGVRVARDTVGARLVNVSITGNGKDGEAYNGDGVQIAGRDTLVRDALISDNGDHDIYEHGIYVTHESTGTHLQRVVAGGNSGTQLRTGGPVLCDGCTFTGGRLSLYAGGTAAEVTLNDSVVGRGTTGGLLSVHGAQVRSVRSLLDGATGAVTIEAAGTRPQTGLAQAIAKAEAGALGQAKARAAARAKAGAKAKAALRG